MGTGSQSDQTLKKALGVFGLHVLAAFCYRGWGAGPGVRLLAAESGEWHLMPFELLREDLCRTLYDLHSQPPLYNAWAGLFAKVFYPAHFEAMVYPQVLMGGAIAAMCYVLLAQWTGRPRFALWAGCLLALNPALLVYEPLGYEILTAFGVTLTVFLFALHDRGGGVPLLAGAICAAALTTLTRSAYHPVLLAPLIVLACRAAGKHQWKRLLAAGLLIAAVPLGWCAKNEARFGFFGTSSWAGQNLWKIASLNHEPEELSALAEAGVIEPRVLRVKVFRLPHEYAPLGFDQKTGRVALDGNNRNNINILGVSRMYGANALRLVRHAPRRYALNTLKAYRLFCQPSINALPSGNVRIFGAYRWVWSMVLQGQLAGQAVWRATGRDPMFSFWLIIIPAAMAIHGVRTVRRGRCVPYGMHAAALLIVYTVTVSCLFEYGENERFKFAIEPVLWVFVLAHGAALLTRQPGRVTTDSQTEADAEKLPSGF